jgi:hypothetical protein
MKRVRGGKSGDVNLKGMSFGSIDVPPWIVKDRIDLGQVGSFMLESHHGIPQEVQKWLDLGKNLDDCPAYLTTMLEHRGAGSGGDLAGIHQRLSQKLGAQMTPPRDSVPLNQGKPDGLDPEMMIKAMEETYQEAGLEHFWEVCEIWMNTP